METARIKTGIFGGTFNPIHIGHLALANYLCEYEQLDELWFMVSPQNPFKANQTLLDDHLRLSMVQTAVKDYPRFRASDFEFGLPRPSYTINTLRALSEAYPGRDFYLIVGADNWLQFDKWRSPDEIIAHHHVLVYPRPGYDLRTSSMPPHVRFVPSPTIDVSSTFIRNSIAAGKDVRYFVHPAVQQIIKELQLYKK